MKLTVWTDGSGTTSGPAGIGYHAQIEGVDAPVEGSLPIGNATNQQAEILAAAYALHELPEAEILVVSDSEYVVKGWNEYLPAWKARGWRTASNKTPKNLAHWKRLSDAVARHPSVRFEWTRGHAGTLGNERADRLAGEARLAAKAAAPPPYDEGAFLAELIATFDAVEIVPEEGRSRGFARAFDLDDHLRRTRLREQTERAFEEIEQAATTIDAAPTESAPDATLFDMATPVLRQSDRG